LAENRKVCNDGNDSEFAGRSITDELSTCNWRILRDDDSRERLRIPPQPVGLQCSTSSFFQDPITRDKQLAAKV